MYQTVDESAFISAFEDIRPESFSRRALMELFSYFESLEEEGEEIELDPVEICCNWAEYTEEELIQEYPDFTDEDGEADISGMVAETTVIVVDHFEKPDTYLVLAF